MEFNHLELKLEKSNLLRDDSRDLRYYIHPDGTEFMSVTSWLSQAMPPGQGLKDWYAQVGQEKAQAIVDFATDKGTAIHDACERLLNNEDNPGRFLNVFDLYDFKVFKKHLEETVSDIVCQEHQMFSRKLRLAGTVDLCASYRSVPSTIDFKTSSGIKHRGDIESYFLQAACYCLMLYEMHKIETRQLVILICVDKDNRIHEYIEPSSKWIKKVLEMRKQ